MSQQMDLETLARVLQAESVDRLTYDELVALIRGELPPENLPHSFYRQDPRNGDRIIYSDARAIRPHDNSTPDNTHESEEYRCMICRGETTGVVDVAELSEGFTFINKNLFPVLFPFERLESGSSSREDEPADGVHLLQWTSSLHDSDWHNMARQDRIIVMQRLALIEKVLLEGGLSGNSENSQHYVIIFKNFGSAVGASLAHGHQQIVSSTVKPRAVQDHVNFQNQFGDNFSAHMLRETAPELLVKDYGTAVMLVPYFMRRPYMTMLHIRDTSKRYLHELSHLEVEAIAEGWHDATRAYHTLMPGLGKDTAYNITMHSGPGAGLYFEFLPFTQQMGGLEHLGLYVCQESPRPAAKWLRKFLTT